MVAHTTRARAEGRAIKPLEPRGSAGAGANSMYGRSPAAKACSVGRHNRFAINSVVAHTAAPPRQD